MSTKKKTDFHFRLSDDLRGRLSKAVKIFTVKGDRRRKSPIPTVSDVVIAFIEAGLARVEAGMPVIDAPSMRAKSARQAWPAGRGKPKGFYLAPLYTPPLYADLQRAGRVVAPHETALFDIAARHIEADESATMRGNVFTQDEALDEHVGSVCKVASISRKRATVKFGRKSATVHVFDLLPEMGRTAPPELIADGLSWVERQSLCTPERVEAFVDALTVYVGEDCAKP